MRSLLTYAGSLYLVIGFLVATIGPAGQQIWTDFRKHSQGTPAELARLGVTQIAPAPMWKCFVMVALSTIFAIILWPGFWNEIFKSVQAKNSPAVPAAWLGDVTTVNDAEAAHMVRDAKLGPLPTAFGFQNERWRELVASMKPGDELRSFSSPEDAWENLAGRAGFAIVREGKVVAWMTTIMN